VSAVEFDTVSKSFGQRIVVGEFTLQIQAGERVVLFGPSGCGKTTVLRLLAGLAVPDKGSIQINGLVVAANGRSLREPEERNVGMVFQDLALWPHLSVWDNLDFGLKARRIPKEIRKERIEKLLSLVGLSPFFQAKPQHLSGGEQQRVALARALVIEPTLLLMDEPLSGLDDSRRLELVRTLVQLHSQLGFTLLYVTHNREEAGLAGNRTVFMDAGRIVSAGERS
jgi:iron(III) transport system ATP-binding protein